MDSAPETVRGSNFLLILVPDEDISRWPQDSWESSLLKIALTFGEVEDISSCLCWAPWW